MHPVTSGMYPILSSGACKFLSRFYSGRWDAIDDICWYRITNTGDWLPWLIGTQIVWIMLYAVGEVAAFLIIVGYLVVYEVRLPAAPPAH